MSDTMTIFHNPRCSKSRQALALLEEKGIDINVVHYLQHPPTPAELKAILTKLNKKPRDILRKGEPECKALKLADTTLSDQYVLEAMIKHPKLIERPIVIRGERAVIGRPPENVRHLL